MFSLPTVGEVLSFGFASFLSFAAIEVVGGGLVVLEVSTDLLVAGIREIVGYQMATKCNLQTLHD